jgi:uncharacterized OB-fold protein
VSVLEPQRGAIAPPLASPLSQPFWDGVERGELRFQRCADCGLATHTPAHLCAHCTSRALSWERSAGTGSVYSWTAIWRPQIPAFEVPYVAVIVELDEGWQMLSNLIGCGVDEVEIGMRVVVDFQPMHGGFRLPYFRPGTSLS